MVHDSDDKSIVEETLPSVAIDDDTTLVRSVETWRGSWVTQISLRRRKPNLWILTLTTSLVVGWRGER